MTSRKRGPVLLACVLACAGFILAPRRAPAAIANATIVVNFKNTTITSTSVTTMAIVTHNARPHRSYIEMYFQTAAGQIGLHIESSDQRRIEAFFQQMVIASEGHGFQITAYSDSTYQPNGYVSSLESNLVYLLVL